MPSYTEQIFRGQKAQSLVWHGDELVDWVGGGVRYRPDGSISRPRVSWGFRFDAAVTEPQGEFTVVYSRVGTKGMLLRNGVFVRELNRSFYHAEAYEYPVALVRRGDRVWLVHCPDEYNKLEIEDAAKGERLTTRTSKAADFFHSRLAVSPNGRYLLSAGWVWHPWSGVVFYDLDEVLRRPEVLNGLDWCSPTSRHTCFAEEESACWLNDDEALLSGGEEEDLSDPEDAARGENRLKPFGLAVFQIHQQAIRSLCVPGDTIGTMMPVGQSHVVAFYKHPRLIRLSDGATELTFPQLASGTQSSSIICSQEVPALALDPARRRFAIAQGDDVHVIFLSVSG
jgi:hypothetical protein